MTALPPIVVDLLLHGVAKSAVVRRAIGARLYRELLESGLLRPRPGRLVVCPYLVDNWTPIVEVQLRCPTAVASHRLAAWIHQTPPEEGRAPRHFEYVATRRSRIAGVRETSDLPPGDVMVVAGVRVTTPARTLADLATAAGEDALEIAGESMLFARLVTEGQLVGAVRRLGARGRRGVPELRRFLRRRGRGARPCESPAEVRFLQLIRRLGFPEPTWRQFEVPRPGAWPLRVDFAWELGRHKLFVEIDGVGAHGNPDALSSDLHRQNYILRTRPALLRFVPDVVDHFPHIVDEHLGAHLRRRRRQPVALAAAS
jgi:hypothetical protein